MKVRYIGTLLFAALLSLGVYTNGFAADSGIVMAQKKAKHESSKTIDSDPKKQTVKKGWNIAPSPSLGYNSDTGFQIGVMSDVFDYLDTEKGAEISAPRIRDSGGMVGFCARRAQKALFQTHSALTDTVFYTKILDSNSPDFFGNFAADFGGTLLTKIAKLF